MLAMGFCAVLNDGNPPAFCNVHDRVNIGGQSVYVDDNYCLRPLRNHLLQVILIQVPGIFPRINENGCRALAQDVIEARNDGETWENDFISRADIQSLYGDV